MVGIKTYVGLNSSQLQEPLGLCFLLWGHRNPTLCCWPKLIRMQQLQKGRSCSPFPPPWLRLPRCCRLCHATMQCWKMVLFARWALSPTHSNSSVLKSLGWLLIPNAESLLKCFTLLCTFSKQTGLPRRGYKSPSWATERRAAQPLVWISEVGTRGELPQRVSAATLPLLEHRHTNKNLREGSPGRESGFLFFLKPVRNLVFWEHVWVLFTNTGGLITRWLMSVNSLMMTLLLH